MNAPAWTIEDHLRDKPEAAVQLYRTVETILLDLGEVTCSPLREAYQVGSGAHLRA